MQASLAEKQAEITHNATKPLVDSQRKIHLTLQQERDRVHFLATLMANAEMKRRIDQIYAEKHKEGGVTLSFSEEDDNAKVILKGITVADLGNFKSLTGRDVYQNKNGEFEMELPRRLFNSGYYNNRNDKLKKDMQTLAMAVKASGYETITMELAHAEPKIALKMAQEA